MLSRPSAAIVPLPSTNHHTDFMRLDDQSRASLLLAQFKLALDSYFIYRCFYNYLWNLEFLSRNEEVASRPFQKYQICLDKITEGRLKLAKQKVVGPNGYKHTNIGTYPVGKSMKKYINTYKDLDFFIFSRGHEWPIIDLSGKVAKVRLPRSYSFLP